ncbi:MAG: ribonuclease III [Phycisphaerales bacterium]|jgi:ribonuclease-3|nr:ribonuclease III [Phycisphaerales bacterium]
MESSNFANLQVTLGHEFKNHDLLERAVSHASGTDHRLQSNERLEFLGDAVLGMVVCSYIYETFPDILEGEMTKIKSMVVSRQVCAEVAEELQLTEYLQLGKGMSSRSNMPASVGAAAFESLIGAVYVDGGLEPAREFILQQLRHRIHEAEESGHHENFKSVLQQHAQKTIGVTPVYSVLDEQGPDHAKCFEVGVEISGRHFDSCWGSSKKRAEQDAALNALIELGFVHRNEDGVITISPAT